jgi:hypothetical protein
MEIREPEAGALRLEARHKFVARMMDAIDSALSKHDQVLITGSSRASRIKASVPACVACDRPLRTKARKGKLMEEEAKYVWARPKRYSLGQSLPSSFVVAQVGGWTCCGRGGWGAEGAGG